MAVDGLGSDLLGSNLLGSDFSNDAPSDFGMLEAVRSPANESNAHELNVHESIDDQSMDGKSDNAEPPAVRALDQFLLVDVRDQQAIDVVVREGESWLLSWDASQVDQLLDALFVDHDVVELHVLYDATQWQLPGGSVLIDESNNFTLRMSAVDSHTARVQVNVSAHQGDADTAAQIFLKITDADSTPADESQWLDNEIDVARTDWETTASSAIIIEKGNERFRVAISNSVVDIPMTFNPASPAVDSGDPSGDPSGGKSGDPSGDKSSDGFGSPASTWVGDDVVETTPRSGDEATPLPELQRDSVERGGRSGRRTFDIRGPVGAQWTTSSSSTISRSAASPESMATQRLLATVYDADLQSLASPSRWMIDPKPARLQVATFLLSRSPRAGTAVVKSGSTSSMDSETTSGPTVQRPTSATQPVINPTVVAAEAAETKGNVRLATVPSMAEVTAVEVHASRNDVLAEGQEVVHDLGYDLNQEVDEAENRASANSEPSIYASVVDRILGSPVSLVAVLGLTVVARIAECEETGNHGL